MRLLFKLVFLAVLLSPVAGGALLYLAIDAEPTVENRNAAISPGSIERAKRVLTQNDPRKLKAGDWRTVSTSAADLDLAVNYLAHQYGRNSARVRLRSGSLESAASIRAPLIPIPLYLNVSLALSDHASTARLEALRIGKVPVPVWLAEWLLPHVAALLSPDFDYHAILNAVKKVNTNEARIAVTYEWQAELQGQLRALVLPPAEQARLRVYYDRLIMASRALPAKNISLTELFVPLFKLAAERSGKNPPAAENRAALLILTIYVNGRSPEKLIPDAKSWPKPRRHGVRLNQREDFPKHFIISAALAANAGGPLADAVGLYKEIEDSRGGSGFSFNDIAADRAGSKFGDFAARDSSAGMLQKKLLKGITEGDIMPATADLPEFMQDADFQRRFGGIDGTEYKKMMAEIERRVAALPLYR